jgi:biotin carboxylase
MQFALICLPYYRHTRRLLYAQLASSAHRYVIFETQRFEMDDAVLDNVRNVERVVVPRLSAEVIAAEITARGGVDRVTSFSDRGLVLASQLRERLELPGNGVEVELDVLDKARTRQRLVSAGLSRLQYHGSTLSRLSEVGCELPFPVIVKPTTYSGSLCVELVHSPGQLREYVERCRRNPIFTDGNVVVESYVPGQEYSVEGLIVGDEPHFFGICERHHSGPPHFIGTDHDFFAGATHEQAPRIQEFIAAVVRCLGLRNCPFHIEMKAGDQCCEVIEAHSRYGGLLIMELVERATGAQPFRAHLDLLAAGSVELPKASRAGLFSEHMFVSPPGIIRRLQVPRPLLEAQRVISSHVDFQEGDRLGSDALSLHHWGYVTFEAIDRRDAQAFRRQIDEGLELTLEA